MLHFEGAAHDLDVNLTQGPSLHALYFWPVQSND